MPKLSTVPKNLKPYIFHGVHLEESGDQAYADCPFCGKERKFSVEIETAKYRCLVCQAGSDSGGGNQYIFLRKLHEISFKLTKPEDYEELAKERGLLYAETLMLWGLAKSITTNEWLIPSYSVEG